MPPAALKYTCLCSKCYRASKMVTKRTLEAHLQQDQQFFQTLSPNTDSARTVKSCIDQNIQFLSQLYKHPNLLGSALDGDGSYSEGPKGALLNYH